MGVLIIALTGAVVALLWVARSTHRRTEVLSRANGKRLQELARLRARIEVLERAQGVIPSTALHSTHPDNKCHVCGGAATKGISLDLQPICSACQVNELKDGDA